MKREFPRYIIYFGMHSHGVCCEMCNILHLLHVAHVQMHAQLTVSKICVSDVSSEPKSDVKVATFGKILGHFSPIVPPSAAGFASVT
jgi:hypothetical protein